MSHEDIGTDLHEEILRNLLSDDWKLSTEYPTLDEVKALSPTGRGVGLPPELTFPPYRQIDLYLSMLYPREVGEGP